MAVLKTCPYCDCGAILEIMAARKGFEADVHCDNCSASIHTITYDTKKLAIESAISIWNRRAEPEPRALTLVELRERNFSWVWAVGLGSCPANVAKYINGYGFVVAHNNHVRVVDIIRDFDDYGKTWLA